MKHQINIKSALKSQFPIIMIDKVITIEDDQRIITVKNVSLNEPIFQQATSLLLEFPGSLILESMVQSGILLLSQNAELLGRRVFFEEAESFKNIKAVEPGDQLRVEMEVVKIKDHHVRAKAIALVEGKMVTEATLRFSFTQKPSRSQIHHTASVHPSAILGKDVVVGPYNIIDENVVIGDRTILEAHVCINKWTKIGEDCHIHYGCVVGSPPQDKKYSNEVAWTHIGDRNIFREYVTVNRATGKESSTQVGSDNMFLTNVHIGHNCKIGNHVTVTNLTHIGGHVEVEDKVILGGLVGIHQFVKIGKGAMIGGYSRLAQDVAPFMLCEGNPAYIRNLNAVGLKRSGISQASYKELKQAFKILFKSKLNTSQAIEELNKCNFKSEEYLYFMNFVKTDTSRGLTKGEPIKEEQEELFKS